MLKPTRIPRSVLLAVALLTLACAAHSVSASAVLYETAELEIGAPHEFAGTSFTVNDTSSTMVILSATDAQGARLLQNFFLSLNESVQAGAVKATLLEIREEIRDGKNERIAVLSFELFAAPSAAPTATLPPGSVIETEILKIVAGTNTTVVCAEEPAVNVEVSRETRVYASATDASSGATLVSLKVRNVGAVDAENIELTEKIPGGLASDAVFDEPPALSGSEAKWVIRLLAAGETREFNYAVKKPVYAASFAQPGVTQKTSGAGGAGSEISPRPFFDSNFWLSAVWAVFLAIVVFIAGQIYFAREEQKNKLLEGPRGYRKRGR
ncbi:MAG: hypothetical protein V1817_02300 [Candidatus Micrarchaeota archaeon]